MQKTTGPQTKMSMIGGRQKYLSNTLESDGPFLVFHHNIGFLISRLSFSQRRFLGFRNRYEFDKKRLLLSSDKEFSVIGYDRHERVFELTRSFVGVDEEIMYSRFLDDHIPSFIFLILWNKKEQCTILKILKLKRNVHFDMDNQFEENNQKLHENVLSDITKGNFKKV